MASLNFTCLPKHIDELRDFLAASTIDILAINETRLDSSIHDNEVHIPGYEIVRRNRSFKVAPYGYSLFVLRALVSTILGNLPITLSCTSLEPIEIKFWEIKLPF